MIASRDNRQVLGILFRAFMMILWGGLSSHAQVEIFSPSPETNGDFGRSVCGLSDLDGDGIGEVLIGAPGEGENDVGRAYVFSAMSGALIHTLVSPSPDQTPFGFGNQFGTSVCGIPDVDGDMVGDFVIGAPNEASGVFSDAGRVYIYSGATGTLIRGIESPNLENGGQFGFALAGTPDVNGDGRGDVFVGAYGEDPGLSPTNAGRAYLYSGATGELLRIFVSPNELSNGQFGYSVGASGDLNSDGVPDLLVGANRESFNGIASGRAYAFSGADGTLIHSLVLPASHSGRDFGFSIARTGDIDDDGIDEIIVGAPRDQVSQIGRAHLFSGLTGQWKYAVPNSPNTLAQSTARYGCAVDSIVDENDDGVDDLIVGANISSFHFNPNTQGALFVFSSTNSQLMRVKLSTHPKLNGSFGASVAKVKGITPSQSGFVVGAPSEDVDSIVGAGRAYVFVDSDCNGNGVSDDDDLATGYSLDCNNNLRPDECEYNGFMADCNRNLVWDRCDILSGSSLDIDENGVPDECLDTCFGTLDCNFNSVPDADELEGNDCDGDRYLDACQTEFPFLRRVSASNTDEPASDPVPEWFSPCFDPVMSRDRRFIAFYSSADNLVPYDTNGHIDVFVKDVINGSVENIHHASDGLPANDSASYTIDMSPDGRFVAFVSEATNLVPENSGGNQVYLFDRGLGSIELISIGVDGLAGNGDSLSPAISSDGRYVCFSSIASNLVVGDTNGYCDVFRRDRVSGTTIRVSVNAAGEQGNNHSGPNVRNGSLYFASQQVVTSDNGRYVAFSSLASNLVPEDVCCRDVFVFDCETLQPWRVNSDGQDVLALGGSGENSNWIYADSIDMTSDGRFVTFECSASNLVTPDENSRPDIFVHDRQLQQVTRIPLGGSGSSQLTYKPMISEDGCFVFFSSNVKGLVPGQDPSTSVIFFNDFRFDLANSSLKLVTANESGIGANATSSQLGVSRPSLDGQFVVFTSQATNLIQSASQQGSQVFLRSMIARPDCNGNLLPDECDLLNNDCNMDNIPDECQCGCPGDVNGDWVFSGNDIQGMTLCLIGGCGPKGCHCAELTSDGIVDLDDAEILVGLLLSDSVTCP